MLATKCKIFLFWPFQISLNEYSSKKNRNSTLAPTPLLRVSYTLKSLQLLSLLCRLKTIVLQIPLSPIVGAYFIRGKVLILIIFLPIIGPIYCQTASLIVSL